MAEIRVILEMTHLFLVLVCMERDIGRFLWRSKQSGPGGHSTEEGVAPEEEAGLTEVTPSEVYVDGTARGVHVRGLGRLHRAGRARRGCWTARGGLIVLSVWGQLIFFFFYFHFYA